MTNGVPDESDRATAALKTEPDFPRHHEIVLSVIQDDIRHVQTRATAALAIAAIFVTQIELTDLQAMSDSWNDRTLLGILLLVVAGVSYFHYSQRLNQARLAVALDPATLNDKWVNPFMTPGFFRRTPLWYYRLGQWCFVLGAVVLFFVIAELILTAPAPRQAA